VRKHAGVLSAGAAASRVGLLVCDEGHRLKAAGGNQTIAALSSLPTRRRVILTGTPLQNNLAEFYSMANFVNPGTFGTLSSFKRIFQVGSLPLSEC
jgi:SNF2 family DNA or RNA helicase